MSNKIKKPTHIADLFAASIKQLDVNIDEFLHLAQIILFQLLEVLKMQWYSEESGNVSNQWGDTERNLKRLCSILPDCIVYA